MYWHLGCTYVCEQHVCAVSAETRRGGSESLELESEIVVCRPVCARNQVL